MSGDDDRAMEVLMTMYKLFTRVYDYRSVGRCAGALLPSNGSSQSTL